MIFRLVDVHVSRIERTALQSCNYEGSWCRECPRAQYSGMVGHRSKPSVFRVFNTCHIHNNVSLQRIKMWHTAPESANLSFSSAPITGDPQDLASCLNALIFLSNRYCCRALAQPGHIPGTLRRRITKVLLHAEIQGNSILPGHRGSASK